MNDTTVDDDTAFANDVYLRHMRELYRLTGMERTERGTKYDAPR